MLKFKKVIFSGLIFLVGLLLSLAGLSLISLSQNLILYSGVGLIGIALLLYFFI